MSDSKPIDKPIDLFDMGVDMVEKLKEEAEKEAEKNLSQTVSAILDEVKESEVVGTKNSEEIEKDSEQREEIEQKEATKEKSESTQEESIPLETFEKVIKLQEQLIQKIENNEEERIKREAFKKVTEMQEQLSSQMANMEAMFQKRIMYTEYEEKILDQMHSEIKKCKEGLYEQPLKPILQDIIEVRESILRVSKTYLEKPEGEQAIPNKTFADYSYDLQDILEQYNVNIYQGNKGDAFVPIKQRIMKKEVTHNESLHGKIADSLSCGYELGGRVISPERVSVYLYEAEKEVVEEKESEDKIDG